VSGGCAAGEHTTWQHRSYPRLPGRPELGKSAARCHCLRNHANVGAQPTRTEARGFRFAADAVCWLI
jgi:hypothetical protein